MNETLVAEKKEYEVKNSLKFKDETSAFNQLNKANQLLEYETLKLKA